MLQSLSSPFFATHSLTHPHALGSRQKSFWTWHFWFKFPTLPRQRSSSPSTEGRFDACFPLTKFAVWTQFSLNKAHQVQNKSTDQCTTLLRCLPGKTVDLPNIPSMKSSRLKLPSFCCKLGCYDDSHARPPQRFVNKYLPVTKKVTLVTFLCVCTIYTRNFKLQEKNLIPLFNYYSENLLLVIHRSIHLSNKHKLSLSEL